MRVLVTGASGYIGKRVTAAFTLAGHEVVAAGRRALPGYDWYRFDLAAPTVEQLPAGIGLILHLAADTTGAGRADTDLREVASARALLHAAQQAGAGFVFVSSQTARVDAPTAYGRNKWQIEQAVLAAGGAVLRPGQVYGGAPRALFGTMVGMVERLPLLPAFLPAPRIQPVHVDDLALGLLALAQRPGFSGRVLSIGAPEPVTFTRFLRAIAQQRLRRARLFVPVPVVLVTAARALSGGRVAPLERLASLFALAPMDSAADLAALGLTLRPLEQGMGTRRRLLLRESATLLRYVLGEAADAGLVRRHARAIERLRGGSVLGLPLLGSWAPGTLRCLEGRGAQGAEFGWRLDCATALAEATPQGARRFLGLGVASGFFSAGLGLAAAVAAEMFWRATGPALRPLLRWR
ncbi:MAG: hypothetical protein JWQ88_1581 [Rhodoferax sp.]|nr:hypothetical protein [Rhodoferax sp.]